MINLTDQINTLKAREGNLTNQLETAKQRRQLTQSALNDSRNIAAGYERSTRPQEIEARDQAKARVDTMLAQLRDNDGTITTIERELSETRAALSALFEGEPGYQNALAFYQDAKRDAQQAASAAQAFGGQQAEAAQALTQARQLHDRATTDQRAALDGKAMAKARAALDSATHAVEDAETLLANLKRHSERLQANHKAAKTALEDARCRLFQTKAARLTEQLREQTTELAWEAFAAALLAGSGWTFREYLADALDPYHEAIPPGVEARREKLLAALDGLT